MNMMTSFTWLILPNLVLDLHWAVHAISCLVKFQVDGNSVGDGPSASSTEVGEGEVLPSEDDDELDTNELDELEASLSRTAIEIQEPHVGA